MRAPARPRRRRPPAGRAARALLAAGLAPVASCGDGGPSGRQLQVAQTQPWACVQNVGALVDDAGRRVCSGVALAGGEVLTSARCARAAVAASLSFAASPTGQGMHRQPLARVVAGHTAGPQAGRPQLPALAAHAASFRQLAQACGVDDILRLGLSASERDCALRRIDSGQLAAMEVMGLGDWHDRGRVRLDGALPLPGARLFAAAAPPPGAALWVVGTRGLRREHGSVQRYFAPWRQLAGSAAEIHAEPEGGQAVVDVGAGLFVEVGPAAAPRLELWGVASRPYVAHGDASAGMIFSRLVALAPASPPAR